MSQFFAVMTSSIK